MNQDTIESNMLVAIEDTKLLESQKNVMQNIKKKYVLIRSFINKVLAPNSIYCLTDFQSIKHETIIANSQNNKTLLKKYSEFFNKILGITSIVTKDTPDDKISDNYIITFLRMCLESIGYVMTKKIDKLTKEARYTISVKDSLIAKK